MDKIYDLLIIGGGSAELSAGIYAGHAKLDTLMIEKDTATLLLHKFLKVI